MQKSNIYYHGGMESSLNEQIHYAKSVIRFKMIFFLAWIPSIQVVVSGLYSTNTPHTRTPLELQPIHISRPSGDHRSCTDLVDGHVVVPLWRHANIQDLQETNPGKIPRCDTQVVPAGNQTQVGGAPTEWLHLRATGSSAGSKWIRILCSLHKLFILST